MQVKPGGLTLGAMADHLTDVRLDQLMRWHGTDESNLPPAHTLQNLSRDTIAALAELRRARQNIADLRAAMGRAFWATDFRELHAILLEALGPPPDEDPPGDVSGGDPSPGGLSPGNASPAHDSRGRASTPRS